jgi:hypothetical protein
MRGLRRPSRDRQIGKDSAPRGGPNWQANGPARAGTRQSRNLIASLAPPGTDRLPDASVDFFALEPAAVAAALLELYGELGEIRMDVAVMNVAQRLDGEMGLSESRRRQVSMMISEACNLLERVGAVCHRADSGDHRVLWITNRGHSFWAMDDPVAALAAAAGD